MSPSAALGTTRTNDARTGFFSRRLFIIRSLTAGRGPFIRNLATSAVRQDLPFLDVWTVTFLAAANRGRPTGLTTLTFTVSITLGLASFTTAVASLPSL